MEELVGMAAKPIGFVGSAILVCGAVYLGVQLKDGLTGGGGLYSAVAMIAAGGIVTAFAALYGFSGF